MIKILFICHGNICRSPMAEFVMKDLVKRAGLEHQFQIASAATSTEEIGNPVYPPAREKLAEHGISCRGKTARQVTRSDYDAYDLLIGMDQANLRNLRRICGGKDSPAPGVCRRPEGVPARVRRSGARGERRSKGAFRGFAAGGKVVKRTLRR